MDTLFALDSLADRNLARVRDLLLNDSGPLPLQPDQRAFLRELERHVGKAQAMPLSKVQDRLCAALSSPLLTEDERRKLHISEDRVKGIVHKLRKDYRVQIGASRDAGSGGYYLIATAEEAEESSTQMYNQAVSMLRVVAIMRGPSRIPAMLDQIRLEIELQTIPDATGTSSQEEAHGK